MDVVGSTAFKIEHKDKPEVWILRVQQFSELMASAALACNGKVVKFIGDEIMVSFANPLDAQNFISRTSEIESHLTEATGFPTKVKVAADCGTVYELHFEGHDTPDPQGMPVDRCARIGKFSLPGEVLASAAFVEKTPKLGWTMVGTTEMKGLGQQVVFQLGPATVNLEPRTEIPTREYSALVAEKAELRAKAARMEEQNRSLQEQLQAAGQTPDPEASIGEEEDDAKEKAWSPVQAAIAKLKQLIDDTPGDRYDLARFVFLYQSGDRGMSYNTFEGKVFDTLIDTSLVVRPTGASNSYYKLSQKHPRNKQILAALKEVQKELGKYVGIHGTDPEDLFEWSLDDPEFWKKYIGYSVL
jgi:class 3 adenylate cyclase